MKDKLTELAILRSVENEFSGIIEKAQKTLEETQEYKDLQFLKEKLKEYNIETAELSDTIKHDAEVEFVHNHLKNTKPYDGIQIKKFKVIHILDERTAISWAATNAPQVLSLKKAPFNKIAKVLDLDFIEIDDEYRAQIASDLSMYEDNTRNTSSTE